MTQKIKLWRSSRDYFFIALGMAVYSFGFCGFILPERVVIGGIAGISTIAYFLTGIPVGILSLVLNLILLAFAYRVVGRQFVLGTIYGTVMISVFMSIFQPLFEGGFTSEPFLNIVIGGMLAGLGIGLAFTHNSSSGGTDIIAAMVNKKTNVTVGRTMLYVDVFIISSGYLLSHEIEKVVFGFIVLFLYTYVVDLLINTNRQAVQFTIFSTRWEQIATAINNEAHRGCTIFTGMGWYSKHEVKMLMVMCRKIEAVSIARIIKSIDPAAFCTQTNVNGVYGKGFDELKVKMKLPENEHSEPTVKNSKTDN